jgi:hypothetical protein
MVKQINTDLRALYAAIPLDDKPRLAPKPRKR